MKKVFKTVKTEHRESENVKDVIQYTLDILSKHPHAEIHIGTDSQNVGDKTNFSTVLAFRYDMRGIHYIYSKRSEVRKRGKTKKERESLRYHRLLKEAIETVEFAKWFRSKFKSINLQLDFDFNSVESHFSNKLISQARDMAAWEGFEINVKPISQLATKAADKHCR